MIQLPGTPFTPLQLQSTGQPTGQIEPWVQEIINKRLTLSSVSNYSTFINSLENYLNFIYGQLTNQDGINNYLDGFQYSSRYIISSSIPWNLPITKHKRKDVLIQWSLKDELTIVLINLSLSYNARSSEIVEKILNSPDHSISDKESQQLWLNSFKIFKKSLEFINFLKQQIDLNNEFFETSISHINFIDCLIQSSIQLSFLSKTIWTLKNLEYDITLNNSINYSTLSRISIFIKDQLKNMLNILKMNNVIATQWSKVIENLIKYINGYLGVLLSIENYKQDKIGFSIGFINFSIENIAMNSNNEDDDDDEDDSKFKKKFLSLKKKIKTDKFNKKKKIKLNQDLLNDLSTSLLQKDLQNLFELLQLLNLKYNMENNNLKFDGIPTSQELTTSYLPSGRSVPIDAKSWIPYQQQQQQQQQQQSSGYY